MAVTTGGGGLARFHDEVRLRQERIVRYLPHCAGGVEPSPAKQMILQPHDRHSGPLAPICTHLEDCYERSKRIPLQPFDLGGNE